MRSMLVAVCVGPVPVAPPQPTKPALPPPTSKQQRSIANGNALQLVELWKALFVGGKLEMAGAKHLLFV